LLEDGYVQGVAMKRNDFIASILVYLQHTERDHSESTPLEQ